MKIKSLTSRKIINSKAVWTIETKLELEDGSIGIASIPGGVSKGKTEVTSLPADTALEKINSLKSDLIGKEFKQKTLDSYLIHLDGTHDKSNLGGNVILSISVAFAKATAKAKNLPLYEHIYQMHFQEVLRGDKLFNPIFEKPEMMMLILEGGLHGSGDASIQEFMVITDEIEKGRKIYSAVETELKRLHKSTNVGAEGALSPDGFDNDQVLTLLSGFLHGETIAIDVAASSFKESEEKIPYPNYDELIENYPITSIEDMYDEEDWDNWRKFGTRYNDKLTVVTDDITTSNPEILKKAIKEKIGNGIIIKPNQIGTVTETLQAIRLAQDSGWEVIISHRGSDTNDDFIADLAIGVNADYVKFGAPVRGERVAKYNRLLEIWEELDKKVQVENEAEKLNEIFSKKCRFLDLKTDKPCNKKAEEELNINGETVFLCKDHYNLVSRLSLM